MDIQTLYNKIAAVPAPISTLLGSDFFIEKMENIDDQFTLPAGSSVIISKLIQRLQIKDIAPEYFSGELAAKLGLEKNKAVLITETIKKDILYPIKKDLADYGIDISLLDKFQMPVTKPLSDSPKIIQDIAPQTPPTNAATSFSQPTPSLEPPKPTPLPINKMAVPAATVLAGGAAATVLFTKTSSATVAPSASSSPQTSTPSPATVTPAKPLNTSDVGWSKTQSSGPVLKLDVSQMPPAAPTPTISQGITPPSAPTPVAKTIVSSSTGGGTISEFDRLGITKRSPLTGPAPVGAHDVSVPVKPIPPAAITTPTASSSRATPASAPVEPPPMILHEDTTFKADEKNAGFRLNKPGSGAEVNMNTVKSSATPSRAAILEFGGDTASAPTPKPATSSGGAMHYTEFKTSLSSVPTANSGPRNISQITPPAPSPAAAIPVPIPRPPQPPAARQQAPQASQAPTTPQPPVAPAQQKQKVIVKDFL